MASPHQPIRLRACATCSRLKMKCRWPENTESNSSAKCIRCARMKQPCHVPDPVQRKRRGKSTRVAQLEEKLDGLVHMLAAQQKNNAISPSSQAPITPESNNPSQTSPAPAVLESQSAAKRAEAALPALVGNASLEFVPGFGVTVLESERYLDLYREEYMPRYPFVVIPRSMSAQEMYADSPCLFWTIMVATKPHAGSTMVIREQFRRMFSERIFIQKEKTTEILQAILVLIAWNMVQNYIDAEADDFLTMAVCIISYLRLDRPLECWAPNRKTLLGSAWSKMKREFPFRGKETQTTADKRAVLGCYHVSAMVGGLFRRGPHLRWSAHLNSYCEQLVAAHEDELDLYSVALAKMLAIAERGYFAIPQTAAESELTTYHPEHEMIINSTERELQDFLQSLRISVRSSHQIQIQYQLCLIRLFELIISMKPPVADSFRTPGASGVFLRTNKIWKFVAAAKELVRRHLECSSAHVAMRPYHECAPLAFTVVWSSRVVFLEASDWEPALARAEFDYPTVVGSLSKQFADAEAWAARAGVRMVMLDDKSSMLGVHSTKMKYIQSWFDARLQEEENPEAASEAVDEVTPATTAAGGVASAAAAAGACGVGGAVNSNNSQDAQMPDLTSQDYLNDFTLANLGGNNDQFWQEYMFFQPPSFYASLGTAGM